MSKTVHVMTANAMRLAADNINDATAFIAIMQENQLTDYRINDPVVVNTVVPASAGEHTLVFLPTTGIALGNVIYCSSIDNFSVVTSVIDNREVPASVFCNCADQNSKVQRVLPPQGQILSTIVTFTPPLAHDLLFGSTVMFAVSEQSSIFIPDVTNPNSDGVPT